MDKMCECHGLPMKKVNSSPNKRERNPNGYWLCSVKYRDNKKRRRQFKKSRMRDLVLQERFARGSKCEWSSCTWDNVLHWHHVDPSSKLFDLGSWAGESSSRSELAIKAELAKCKLLCPNHHALADLGVLIGADQESWPDPLPPMTGEK